MATPKVKVIKPKTTKVSKTKKPKKATKPMNMSFPPPKMANPIKAAIVNPNSKSGQYWKNRYNWNIGWANPYTTRFPRFMQPTNLLDQVKATTHAVQGIANAVTPVGNPDTGVVATGGAITTVRKTDTVPGNTWVPDGHYYSLSMDFAFGDQKDGKTTIPPTAKRPEYDADELADWGSNWHNPIVNPYPNTQYLMRVKIAQHRIEPLMSGFILMFKLGGGWKWDDGQGDQFIVEAVSNPTTIIRLIKSPAKISKGTKSSFACTVIQMIPGY